MSSKPNGSPPPYEYDPEYQVVPQPAYSYYADDELKHFYRWNSPPGIIKLMAVIIVVLCVGIFACVASTLAWDTSSGGLSGFAGIGGGGGGYYGGSYGTNYGMSFGGGAYGAGNNYGYGGYNYYNDPRQGKGFMIAVAIICFLALLTIFIMVISHQSMSHGRKFYLAIIITCAILAGLMFIATIVYLVSINPMAQSSGSIQYTQIMALCSQYQNPVPTDIFVNQYLYHYCVVDPQEAVAIVLGFLVTAALVIIVVFAVKTRKTIIRHGKENILWHRVKELEPQANHEEVEAWVNDVSGSPEPVVADYPEKFGGSRNNLDDDSSYRPPYNYTPVPVETDPPLSSVPPYSSGSDRTSSAAKPPKRRPRRRRGRDGQEYDADYASSADELDDDDDFTSEFPPVHHKENRDRYKREFDKDHQEYKDLQADLDGINRNLAKLDQELDQLEEGSPQYLDAVDDFNNLKDQKKSADYQMKKRRCKYLKARLSHIKKMVNDFDQRS
ncbi:occludin [Denticeps clupeoides]|uniref:Occludin n=1 Tax=Denticeps clupeoides TaxID=299321 RepID=A0AAY4EBB5_9TELE|nr:occludin-like [Denticeps clupeoides]